MGMKRKTDREEGRDIWRRWKIRLRDTWEERSKEWRSVRVCVCRGGGAGEVRDNPRAAVVNTGELNLHTYCQLLLSIWKAESVIKTKVEHYQGQSSLCLCPLSLSELPPVPLPTSWQSLPSPLSPFPSSLYSFSSSLLPLRSSSYFSSLSLS